MAEEEARRLPLAIATVVCGRRPISLRRLAALQYVEQQAMSGRFLQSIRLDVPLKALTSTDTDSFGGYSTRMQVISLPVAGQQPTIDLGEDLPSVPRQPLQCRCSEYLAPAFGDADQVNDKSGSAVFSAPEVFHYVGRPSRWNE